MNANWCFPILLNVRAGLRRFLMISDDKRRLKCYLYYKLRCLFGGFVRIGRVRILQVCAVLASVAVIGTLMYGVLAQQSDNGPNTYVTRPTFYNLPVIIYSNSTYTDEIREHVSYCTFDYDLTTNTSHIVNAPNDVPIMIDGYSLDVANDQDLVSACSKALLNGSVIITMWDNVTDFMQQVRQAAYGPLSYNSPIKDSSILSIGLWNGENGVQPSESTVTGEVGPDGPSMATLTESYEWCVRIANDQPNGPTLYP
ncbi:MAG: hypothetical protein SA339_06120 [Methanomassiliicoccus sp.]|nr:hypothetical protein [Methanomassiliicoccus sp.]